MAKVFFVLALYASCSVLLTSAKHLHLSDDFMVTYNVNKTANRIDFEIEANSYGWVALGFNDKGSMPGADIFMGGVRNGTNSTYGRDYHVPKDAVSPKLTPQNDTKQDWTVDSGYRMGLKVVLKIHRALNTTDTEHDMVIGDKDIYLLYAFNNKSDNTSEPHTFKKQTVVNFLSNAGESSLGAVGLSTLIFSLLATFAGSY